MLNKAAFLAVLAGVVLFLAAPAVRATEYVLPYPGFMPGHKFYKLAEVWEKAETVFVFGDLSRYKYHLDKADKSLVEAKTLFEYKQYRLALIALEKAEKHFQKASFSLKTAVAKNKALPGERERLKNAVIKYTQVLTTLNLPAEFLWEEENGSSYDLKIAESLSNFLKTVTSLSDF